MSKTVTPTSERTFTSLQEACDVARQLSQSNHSTRYVINTLGTYFVHNTKDVQRYEKLEAVYTNGIKLQ